MKPRKFFVQEYYAGTGTYRLHRSDEAPVFGPIRAKNLSNEHDAMEFIRRLRMDHADWLRLLHEMNALTANSRLSLYYSLRDVATLASGYHRRIRFYQFDELTYDFDGTDNHYPVINTAPGVAYHFVPSSILLLSDPDPEDIHCFTTHEWQQAEQFLDSLALTDEQLATIIPGLKLRFGGKVRPGPARKERLDCLRNALTGGEIVTVRVQESITPPRHRGQEDLPVEKHIPKSYTLGPHEEPGYVPPPVAKSKTEQPNDDDNDIDDIRKIRRLMKSQNPIDRQEAINKAIKKYEINMKGVKFVKYNNALEDNGITSKNGVVEIGKAAFSTTSPGWLGSTLGHEIEVHIQEQALKGNWWIDEQGTAMQEVQAYDYELKNAERYGLTKEEIKELRWARKDYYLDLNDKNKALVNKYNYSVYIP